MQFKFYLTNGSLYSFWVTPSAAGASYGYVGGGGAHYVDPTTQKGNKDTVGLGVVPNKPPVVNAGANKKVMMPNAVTLAGSVSDDGQPNPPATCTARGPRSPAPAR